MTEDISNSSILTTNQLTLQPNISIFDFIKDPEKLKLLISVNEKMNINKSQHNRLIFVYSAPKVGSTSIVSSLRIFGLDKFDIIHIHDEEMLQVLSHVHGITIKEIILFNKYLGKDIYVINIYRSPIERKISSFFEKVGSYHFNNTDQQVNTYNISKVINRFNHIFPYLSEGDHFLDRYNIKYPNSFDWEKKYLLVKEHDINYISLRLKDSSSWGQILSNIFGCNIHTIKDYESSNKPIKDLYIKFKDNYRIPINFLKEIMNCKYFNYYYSPSERNDYCNEWLTKSTQKINSYTVEQYKIYQEITLENVHIDSVQYDHYIDEGCSCKACFIKRTNISMKIMSGIITNERIQHSEAKTELIQKRIVRANTINQVIRSLPPKTRGKDFKRDMNNIVKGKR
jgi:hypothetical protein